MGRVATGVSREDVRPLAETMVRRYRAMAGGDAEEALRMLAADRVAELGRLRRRIRFPAEAEDPRG